MRHAEDVMSVRRKSGRGIEPVSECVICLAKKNGPASNKCPFGVFCSPSAPAPHPVLCMTPLFVVERLLILKWRAKRYFGFYFGG